MKELIKNAATSFSFKEGSKEFIRIFQTFLKNLKIENFYYARITKKGELVYITNRVDFILNYWEEGLPLFTGFAESPKEVQSIVSNWEGVIPSEVINFSKLHGCYDGFSFCNRYYDTVQFASFLRSHPIDRPDGYYLKNENILRCWLQHFDWEMRHLIAQAKEKPILLPQEYILPQKQAFCGERTIKIRYRSLESKVTLREMDCLHLFSKGFTCAFIAGMLQLSPRTVETHLESVKNRFGLFSRDDLATLAYANPQVQNYFPRLGS